MSTKKKTKAPAKASRAKKKTNQAQFMIKGHELAILRIDKQMEDGRQNTVKVFSNIGQQFNNLLTRIIELERRLPAPPTEKAWVPKVGDLAIIKDNSIIGAGVISEDRLKMGWRIDFPGGNYRLVGRSCVVKPTEAEIAAYRQEQEWVKKTELEEGDACETSLEQRGELIMIASDASLAVDKGDHFRSPNLWWHTERPCLQHCVPKKDATAVNNWLPFPEFKRRLLGTIARLKKEAEEREASVVLTFGMEVWHRQWSDRVYRYAAIDPTEILSRHWVVSDSGKLVNLDRSEFTTIKPQ